MRYERPRAQAKECSFVSAKEREGGERVEKRKEGERGNFGFRLWKF